LRWLRFFFYTNLVLLTCVTSVLFFHRSQYRVRMLLVEYRDGLITRLSSDNDLFTLTPAELVRRGFQVDSPTAVDASRLRLTHVMAISEHANRQDDVELVKAIVLSFSRGGGSPPTYFMPLSKKITEARRGRGFCSDHVEIFLALSELYGVFAREIQNETHGFAEFFSASRNKWIWIDPLLAILAADDNDGYLSALEIRHRRLNNLPVHYQFFGTASNGVRSEDDPRFKRLYGERSYFRRYVLTYGNNVLTEADRSAAIPLLPWEVRQLMLYGLGIKPRFVQLVDVFGDHREIAAARQRKEVLMVVALYFTMSFSAYPLACFGVRFINQMRGAPSRRM